ncbi:hypothetical protein CHUAL_011312 [Chamberlinius hualienensis]
MAIMRIFNFNFFVTSLFISLVWCSGNYQQQPSVGSLQQPHPPSNTIVPPPLPQPQVLPWYTRAPTQYTPPVQPPPSSHSYPSGVGAGAAVPVPPVQQPSVPSLPQPPPPSPSSPTFAAEIQKLQLQQLRQQQQQQQQQNYGRQTAPAYVPIQQAYTVAYYPTYQPSTPQPPSGPYVPAPPGQRPYCAKEGQTYCEEIEYYPTKIVLHLLESTDLENLLVNEGETDELRPMGYFNITPTYFYDYSYTTNSNGRQLSPNVNLANDYYGQRRPQRRIRRQLGDDDDMCPTNKKFATAKAAQNAMGNWKYIVNLPEVDKKYTQAVETTACRSSQCRGLCTPPSGSSSRCEQQYINTRLISLDPGGDKFNNEVFTFPHGCICKISPPI